MAELSLDPALRDIPPSRPHPAWIITAVLSSVRNFIAAFIAIAFSVRDRGIIAITIAMLIPGLAIIIWRALQWQAMRYSAQNGAISLSTGLLEKHERTIQIERVQSVDTLETPIGRIFSVGELQISTAGAAQPITIPAISNDDGEQLRRWIEASRAGIVAPGDELDAGIPASPAATIIHQLSPRDVLLAGLTAGRIAPALALAAAGWRLVSDILPDSVWDRIPIDPNRLTLSSVVALFAAAAIAAWGLSLAGAMLTLWDFTVQRTPDSLILSRGLLDRKQNTLPIQRIQAVSVVEGVLRQPFGFASVMLESAARPHGSGEGDETRYLFPFIRKRDIPALIDIALPEFAWSDAEIAFQRLPTRARSRYLVPVVRDFAILLVVICAVLAFVPRVEWWYGLFLLPLLPPWLLLGYLQYRETGWSHDQQDRLYVQYRSLDKTLTVTRGRRVQIRELSSNYLQRRADLGTLTLRLATIGGRGTMTLRHVDYRDNERLVASLWARAKPAMNPQVHASAVARGDLAADLA